MDFSLYQPIVSVGRLTVNPSPLANRAVPRA